MNRGLAASSCPRLCWAEVGWPWRPTVTASFMRPHPCSVDSAPQSLDHLHLSVQKSVKMKAVLQSWIHHLRWTPSDVPISQMGKLRPGDMQHFAHSYKQKKETGWDFTLGLPDLVWNTATYWFSVLHTSALGSWFLEIFQYMKIQGFKLGHLKFFIWLLNLVK